jgi:hypothetical protein
MPRVVDAWSPCGIVALTFHLDGAYREVDAEPATYKQHERRPMFFADPFRPSITRRVYAPLDL